MGRSRAEAGVGKDTDNDSTMLSCIPPPIALVILQDVSDGVLILILSGPIYYLGSKLASGDSSGSSSDDINPRSPRVSARPKIS